MKRKMKIRYLVYGLLVTVLLLTHAACTKTQQSMTIRDALAARNIDSDAVVSAEIIDKIALVFFTTGNGAGNDQELNMGILELRDDGWHYLIASNIDKNWAEPLQASLRTVDIEGDFEGMQVPGFYLEYGLVNNPEIKTVQLQMNDAAASKEATAKIINVGEERIWYIVRDNPNIYNLVQGLAADGRVIADS